ncbi:hypothetical protein [Streptantibioticus silvisoli]|uniref:DUF3159 domain-containing protein n=1 Tax=Streptantibioticus silvisoli TaxID=2705255 RepID=A0ABT6VY26_9ACTN|nr:hypothetical protein [Streptantibioticus silvisoli]MDI5963380.1 hypothetical protein [Streptantibioticus silvisoli]
MTYLRGFLPWITFSVLSTVGWQWGAAAALAGSVLLLLSGRRRGTGGDAQILDFGTIAYFTALTAFAFADPHSPLQTYDGALSSAWLALIAWSSLAVRRPFTLGIARQRTAPEVWDTPLFRRTNVVITLVWTVSFSYAAAAGYLCDAHHAAGLLKAANQAVGFGVPACFTHWYSARVRARRTTAGRLVPSAEL